MYGYFEFGHNVYVGFVEQINGFVNNALLVVFDGYYAVLGAARVHRLKHRLDGGQGHVLAHGSKSALGGLVREAAFGPQIGHALGQFNVAGGGKNFQKNGFNSGGGQWALVVGHHAVEDLFFSLGSINQRLTGAFQLTHFLHPLHAAVQKQNQLVVQRIYLVSYFV